jgi:hypothetical protein
MFGTNGGPPFANVLWVKVVASGEPSTATLNALALFMGEAWGNNIISHMSSNVVLSECEASYYKADGDILKGVGTFSLAGADSGTNQTAQVSAGISWLLGVSYKGGHPRQYVPGVTSNHLLNSYQFTPLFVSTLTAGANTFRNNVNSYTSSGISSVQFVTMSFVRNKAFRPVPIAIPIIGVHVDNRPDTQRRRLGADVV